MIPHEDLYKTQLKDLGCYPQGVQCTIEHGTRTLLLLVNEDTPGTWTARGETTDDGPYWHGESTTDDPEVYCGHIADAFVQSMEDDGVCHT